MEIKLDSEEIILLKKLVEAHIEKLELYNAPIIQPKTSQDIGYNATKAINMSTAKRALEKINNSINNSIDN